MAGIGQAPRALLAASDVLDDDAPPDPSHDANPIFAGDPPDTRRPSTRGSLAFAALVVLAALLPALWMWDFTIDDALISIRYARHLAGGSGYRFNALGASTDGVTPLPWPFLIAPLARGASALEALFRVKCLGLAAWLLAAAGWGSAIARARASSWAKAVAVTALATCIPVAAHAVSGMETGVAIALATWASIEPRPRRAAWVAGAVAAFRPEMVVWAVVLLAARGSWRGALAASLPFVACGVLRLAAFGHAAPLALTAKPSDLAHGATYAAAGALVALAPVLAASPVALARARGPARAIVLAGAAHFIAIALVGGDWMPFARLVAPVAPGLLYAFVLASPHAHRAATAARAALALALAVFVLAGPARAGRHVGASYRSLVAAARPYLEGRRVASLDIGWPSAATESTIVDLAGLTDPDIAALPGGHTSKRIDAALLLARDPDVILLYAASTPDLGQWRDAFFTRVVDARLAASDVLARHYEARAFLPHGTKNAGYVVLTRTN